MLLAILACASGAPDSADTVATGTPADSRGDDSTRDDTGTRTDSTVDSVVDSGHDSALTDTGLDTAATDTGTDTGSTDTGVLGSLVADFLLYDENRGSVRYGEGISPRDYLTRVSGWYFVHAT